jgi:putative endonuclease
MKNIISTIGDDLIPVLPNTGNDLTYYVNKNNELCGKYMDGRTICYITNERRWFVYMILCADSTIYTGVTTNIGRRLGEHNIGKGAKYTKGRTPVKLLSSWYVHSKVDAYKLEYKIKKLSREQKLSVIKNGVEHDIFGIVTHKIFDEN